MRAGGVGVKIVVFGLTVSSSWGNGHATLWRALGHALRAMGHEVVFFERDVPYYASTRDEGPYGCTWVLYDDFGSVVERARRELSRADAAMVTSYCPDARRACELVLEATKGTRVFYDLDTPVTLERVQAGEPVEYLPAFGLGDFDLVLSFAGGPALDAMREHFGARKAAPLYGSVDLSAYRPVEVDAPRAELSYLGTYAADRHDTFRSFFLDVARDNPARSFVVGGAMYPQDEVWPRNVRHVPHVPPASHPAFFASSRLTLNVTRRPMMRLGHCPSGRLFEAAACATPIVSDDFPGIEGFFEPGREILVARSKDDVESALGLDREELRRIGRAARERVLAEHGAEARAKELVELLSSATPVAPRR